MRTIMSASILAVFLLLAACQTDDEGLNSRNNTEYQRTTFDDRDNNRFTNDDYRGNNFNNDQYGDNFRDRNQMNRNDDRRGTNDFNRRDDRTDYNDDNQRFDVAEEIADRVTDQVDEVDRAYVLAGDNNAYVAVVLSNNDNRNNNNNNDDIDDDLKQRVTEAVQNADQSIRNVYVSANPQFVQTIDDYVNEVQNGRPVEGFFEEFTVMIQRIFPNVNR